MNLPQNLQENPEEAELSESLLFLWWTGIGDDEEDEEDEESDNDEDDEREEEDNEEGSEDLGWSSKVGTKAIVLTVPASSVSSASLIEE